MSGIQFVVQFENTDLNFRLFGGGKDDLVGWFIRDDGSHWYGVWKNNGDYNNARFDKINDMSTGSQCIPRGIHFVDLNGQYHL